MATVHHLPTFRNPIQHNAHYAGYAGIATLRPGGYLFQPDGCRDRFLVAYTDQDLVLLGRCDLAPADERPLWQQVADPATYNGTYGRTLVQGR